MFDYWSGSLFITAVIHFLLINVLVGYTLHDLSINMLVSSMILFLWSHLICYCIIAEIPYDLLKKIASLVASALSFIIFIYLSFSSFSLASWGFVNFIFSKTINPYFTNFKNCTSIHLCSNLYYLLSSANFGFSSSFILWDTKLGCLFEVICF